MKKNNKKESIIKGSFDSIIKASVLGNPIPKKKVKKAKNNGIKK